MNDAVPYQPDDNNAAQTAAKGWYYFQRVRPEFVPGMSAVMHTEFGAIIDRTVKAGEYNEWLALADLALFPCGDPDCLGMGELCPGCGTGHCPRHPHAD